MFLILTVTFILILPQVVLAQNSLDGIQNEDIDTSNNLSEEQGIVEKIPDVDNVNEESNTQEEDGGFFGLFGGNANALGSDDPIIKGTIASMFAVAGLGVMVALTNSAVRKKW